MAGLSQSTSDVARRKEYFAPKEALHDPCDVTLVIEDGKEFRVHRQVLSEASPFFEKLLKTDMKERKEGIVRLEMLTGHALGDILEFIYTGSVLILDEDKAQELVAMADYLFLPHLKTLAERALIEKLEASNCISTYYFAERHHCQELVPKTREVTLRNFAMVAKTQDFLNISSSELEALISMDELHVNAEEDVFEVVLSWIMHNKKERNKYFPQLLCQLRLVYISRNYLRRVMLTNELIKSNKACLGLVTNAIKSIDSGSYQDLSVKPRRSLEIPVMVVCVENLILCYFPREKRWCRLRNSKPPCSKMFSCHGQLYFLNQVYCKLYRYNSLSNNWTTLPYRGKRNVQQVCVSSDNEIYALVTDDQTSCRACISLRPPEIRHNEIEGVDESSRCGKRHLSCISKYNQDLNLWENVSSFDLGSRDEICIVAKDSFIYFIGGRMRKTNNILSDVDRFDLSSNKWEKRADIQEPRKLAYGAVANGKIFVTDDGRYNLGDFTFQRTCEVHNEATDEWHFIASLSIPRSLYGSLMCTDGKLYGVDVYLSSVRRVGVRIEYYDHIENVWQENTDCEIPIKKEMSMGPIRYYSVGFSSMRVFQGSRFLKFPFPDVSERCKCRIV